MAIFNSYVNVYQRVTGWWCNNHLSSSMGRVTFLNGKIKFMFQTTNQLRFEHVILAYFGHVCRRNRRSICLARCSSTYPLRNFKYFRMVFSTRKQNCSVHPLPTSSGCSDLFFHIPWRIHGFAILMVTWIPSIYPLYVSIYTSTMDPMGMETTQNHISDQTLSLKQAQQRQPCSGTSQGLVETDNGCRTLTINYRYIYIYHGYIYKLNTKHH